MKKNFDLLKLTVFGYGLIFGENKYGSMWMEVRFAKKLVKQINFRNRDKMSVAQYMEMQLNETEIDCTPSFVR